MLLTAVPVIVSMDEDSQAEALPLGMESDDNESSCNDGIQQGTTLVWQKRFSTFEKVALDLLEEMLFSREVIAMLAHQRGTGDQ